jgi:hypothetical protein
LFRTRDGWSRVPAGQHLPHELCHCLYRDRATGFVQYILVTSPALYAAHPRADVRRYPNQPDALESLSRLGRPAILGNPW